MACTPRLVPPPRLSPPRNRISRVSHGPHQTSTCHAVLTVHPTIVNTDTQRGAFYIHMLVLSPTVYLHMLHTGDGRRAHYCPALATQVNSQSTVPVRHITYAKQNQEYKGRAAPSERQPCPPLGKLQLKKPPRGKHEDHVKPHGRRKIYRCGFLEAARHTLRPTTSPKTPTEFIENKHQCTEPLATIGVLTSSLAKVNLGL